SGSSSTGSMPEAASRHRVTIPTSKVAARPSSTSRNQHAKRHKGDVTLGAFGSPGQSGLTDPSAALRQGLCTGFAVAGVSLHRHHQGVRAQAEGFRNLRAKQARTPGTLQKMRQPLSGENFGGFRGIDVLLFAQ